MLEIRASTKTTKAIVALIMAALAAASMKIIDCIGQDDEPKGQDKPLSSSPTN